MAAEKTSAEAKRNLKTTRSKKGVTPLQRKKSRAKWFWIGGGAFIAFMLAVFLTPPYGTERFGICKTFVELSDHYPKFLEFVQAYEEDPVVIIDYNRIDSFGQRSLNQIRCYFKDAPNTYELSRVDINGKARKYSQEDPAYVEKFNAGVPSLLVTTPSLKLPPGLPTDIKDYR